MKTGYKFILGRDKRLYRISLLYNSSFPDPDKSIKEFKPRCTKYCIVSAITDEAGNKCNEISGTLWAPKFTFFRVGRVISGTFTFFFEQKYPFEVGLYLAVVAKSFEKIERLNDIFNGVEEGNVRSVCEDSRLRYRFKEEMRPKRKN